MDKKKLTIGFIILMFAIMGAEIYFGIIKKNQSVSTPAGTPPSATSGAVGTTGQVPGQTSPLSGTGYHTPPPGVKPPSLSLPPPSQKKPTLPKPPANYKPTTGGAATITPKINIIVPSK